MQVFRFTWLGFFLSLSVGDAQSAPRLPVQELVTGACARAVMTYVAEKYANPTATDCLDKQLRTLQLLKDTTFDRAKFSSKITYIRKNTPTLGEFEIETSYDGKKTFFTSQFYDGNQSMAVMTRQKINQFTSNNTDEPTVKYMLTCLSLVQKYIAQTLDANSFQKPTTCKDRRLNQGQNTTQITSQLASGSRKDYDYIVINAQTPAGKWFSLRYFLGAKQGHLQFPLLITGKAKLQW